MIRRTSLRFAIAVTLLLPPTVCFAGPPEDVAAATKAWADAYNSRDPSFATPRR